MDISVHNLQELFKFRGPINGFKIPFQKEETWFLTNPAVSFLLLNQEFIREMYASEEILGEEKEMIFYEEYKDNIPNTKIRYYEIKEDVLVTNAHELDSEMGLEDFNHQYSSIILRMYGTLLFCKENIENYRKDLTIKTFAILYNDSVHDRDLEEEIEKIAIRIPFEEALIKYKKDIETLNEKQERKEIEEVISKYKRKFHKSHLSPEEFFKKEKMQAEQNLVRVLRQVANKKRNN